MVNFVSSWENNGIATPPFSYLSTVNEGIHDNLFVDIGFLGNTHRYQNCLPSSFPSSHSLANHETLGPSLFIHGFHENPNLYNKIIDHNIYNKYGPFQNILAFHLSTIFDSVHVKRVLMIS